MNNINTDLLLKDIKKIIKSYKYYTIKFEKHNTKHIILDGYKINGYFGMHKDKIRLAYSAKQSDWFYTLAHEFNHFLQWTIQTNCQIRYNKYFKDPLLLSNSISRDKAIIVSFELERECEINTVEFLKCYGLSNKDSINYIKKANAYTLFYFYIRDHNKWYKINKEPYKLESVYKHFPGTFDTNIKDTYSKLKYLYDQCV